ncbi:MAG: sulfatase-like hydrolase/transferase [Planctomycetes bacterium]|nr:sulfatase-like hydrolase/transferase [Planctomycetota bacterium]
MKTAACLAALLACVPTAGAAERVKVVPEEIDDLLANPGMGWQTFHRFARDDKNLAGLPSGCAYFRFYWKDIEPAEGKIDFEKLDGLLAQARRSGQRFAFRVMCAGTTNDDLFVPAWLKDKGCPGFEYRYQGRGATHWIPDMDHPMFQEAHFRLIRSLGERYDGHPDLDLVDIGTVGHWGEWHMSGTKIPLPKPETRAKIIDVYCEAFPRTPKVMLIGDADGMERAIAAGCGWRADCLGDWGGFSKTWCHMRDFYPQQIEKTRAGEAWKTGPVAFESCWDMRKWSEEGWDIRGIFDFALAHHSSYINNKSAPIPDGTRPEVERCLRRLGYRLVLRSLEYDRTVEAGGTLSISMTWDNIGVAPPYHDLRIAVFLKTPSPRTEKRPIVIHAGDACFVESIKGWLPGTHKVEAPIRLMGDAVPGTYDLAIGIVDPVRGDPAVRLAIEGRDEEGWYPLGKVEVTAGGAARIRRPNVVFVLTDDQRWDAMSCAGHPFLKTPNLDRLAAEGARFRNAFVTTSLCSPSRASFLSGLYASTHGVINNFTDYPVAMPSFPRRLQAEGYETAYIGKWHMGEQNDEPRPGFDYWASHKGQGTYYDTTFNVNGERVLKKGYYTHVVTDMACDWLRRSREKPFCLLLGHKASHGPFVPEEKYLHVFDDVKIEYPASAFRLEGKPEWVKERLDTWHGIYGPLYEFRKKFPDRRPEAVADFGRFVRSYLGTLLSVDDSVGRIYDTLRDLGVLDDTLFIFAGDNSFLLGEHGMIDKRTMHEESIRIPLLARYPRLIQPGTLIDRMVLNIDLAPSILDICGAPPLAKVHGRSWKPLLQGKTDGWRTSWFYEYNYEKQFPYTPNVRGVRTDEWAYVHYPHGDGKPDRHKAELYNVKEDPQELHNLIDDPACAAKKEELKAELARLMEAAGALPDRMPIDEGIKTELPEESIR